MFIAKVLFGVLSLTRAEEHISTPPFKISLNTDVLRNAFQFRD